MNASALATAPRDERSVGGGAPARRAVVRWAWRLFRREWRQQFLILALITVAVAAAIVGSAVATNAPPPRNSGFGSAQDAIFFPTYNARTASIVASLKDRFGRVEVIENETEPIPSSTTTFQLRAETPHGPFSGPMLSLVSGRFPTTAQQAAVTSGLALALHLRVGGSWRYGGLERRVVGIVENPQAFLDQFALVLPGQVTNPTGVIALFDASGVPLSRIGHNAQTPASITRSSLLNPETISLAAVALGMLLIALVSVGGFTVLAQRRLRSIGMLESIGATDRHVRLVVSANGTVVGLIGALLGLILGVGLWLAYRPNLEHSVHHAIGTLALPWKVVAAALLLAVLAALAAASRPARTLTKLSIIQALSGRPAPPREIRRSAPPGVVLLVLAFVLLGYAARSSNGSEHGGRAELVLGIVLLISGLILLAPFVLSVTARLGSRAPIATRLALRDLARYRARSGSALAAITVGVLIAVIVVLFAAVRYAIAVDYVGPNLSSNELALHANVPLGPTIVTRNARGQVTGTTNLLGKLANPAKVAGVAHQIATSLGAQLIALQTPDAGINVTQGGRQCTARSTSRPRNCSEPSRSPKQTSTPASTS